MVKGKYEVTMKKDEKEEKRCLETQKKRGMEVNCVNV